MSTKALNRNVSEVWYNIYIDNIFTYLVAYDESSFLVAMGRYRSRANAVTSTKSHYLTLWNGLAILNYNLSKERTRLEDCKLHIVIREFRSLYSLYKYFIIYLIK